MTRNRLPGGKSNGVGIRLTPCGHWSPCGCDEAVCCFQCPLPACKYDAGESSLVLDRKARDSRILELVRKNYTARDIAQGMRMNLRTVYGVLGRHGIRRTGMMA